MNVGALSIGLRVRVKGMGPEGIEPSPPCGERILSAARLPVPPWSRQERIADCLKYI